MTRLHAVLATCFFCGAAAVRGEPYERFPLSGVWQSGVRIDIRFEIGDDSLNGDTSVLAFLTHRKELFERWHFEKSSSTLNRTSFVPGGGLEAAVSWGGWPLVEEPLEGRHHLSFYKIGNEVATYIDGQRTRWLDFIVPDSIRLTHLDVFAGLSRVEMVVTRSTCSTSCHADECTDAHGQSTCMVDGALVDSSECTLALPGQHCTDGDDSGIDVSAYCCLGEPDIVDFNSVDVGDWVEVQSHSSSELANACNSFGVDDARCLELSGKFSKVMSKDDAQRTFNVWTPTVDLTNEQSQRTLPFSAVRPKLHAGGWFYEVPKESMGGITVDAKTKIITEGPAEIKGWFVNLMHEREYGDPNEPWVLYIQDRWEYWRDAERHGGVDALLTDIEAPVPECDDLLFEGSTWKDKNDDTCETYLSKGWCTIEGEETDQWWDDHPRRAPLYRKQTFERVAGAPERWYGPKACCACGGGQL